MVVVFITLLQTTQDGDGTQRIRFIDIHDLEAAFQCFVLFKVLLILVEGRCADTSQFATSQCGFQDVGGIHSAFTFSSTNQSVDFINKENYVSF